ncbi:hypothetical protein Bbelb_254090 [Branchiostoma belcheri]|nr:hypothetical protein Bbelb_254090 [Branchiostoma belcheri]
MDACETKLGGIPYICAKDSRTDRISSTRKSCRKLISGQADNRNDSYRPRDLDEHGSTGHPRFCLVPETSRRVKGQASVTTRRTCFCVLSTCKNVGNRTASVRAYERATYGLRESNFTILTCNCCTDSARSTCVPRTVLASSVLTPHFPVDLLNDHAEHTCTIPGAPHVLRTCNVRATHLISTVYKDNLTGGCQLVSKIPRKAQKKTTRQDPKKRAAEDTRAASDDEVNRRCTHLQRASE